LIIAKIQNAESAQRDELQRLQTRNFRSNCAHRVSSVDFAIFLNDGGFELFCSQQTEQHISAVFETDEGTLTDQNDDRASQPRKGGAARKVFGDAN
jgi:hypothetical protein